MKINEIKNNINLIDSYLYDNIDINYQTAVKHLIYYLVIKQKRNLSHIRCVIEKKQDNYLK